MTTPSSSPFLASQFPIARAALSTPGRVGRFDEALSWLNNAVDAGWIANQVYIEIKSRFRSALGDAWQARVADLVYAERGPVLDLYFSIQSDALHLLSSTRKKIAASKLQGPVVEAMLAVVGEFDPLAVAMESMKTKVTKRQVKTAEEREAEARFAPTPATPAATRKVYDALVEITARNYASMVTTISSEYTARLHTYMQAGPERRRKLYGSPEYRSAVIAALKEKRTPRDPDELRADWEGKIQVLAERDATQLRDAFILKVLRKLAPIVEAKGGLRSAKEIRDSVQVSRLSGTLKVEFEDGSSFLADNNIVYSHSSLGRLFARFPLTFHKVVMADGSYMKSPCEERMHTVFAGVSAPADTVDEEEQDEPEAPRG